MILFHVCVYGFWVAGEHERKELFVVDRSVRLRISRVPWKSHVALYDRQLLPMTSSLHRSKEQIHLDSLFSLHRIILSNTNKSRLHYTLCYQATCSQCNYMKKQQNAYRADLLRPCPSPHYPLEVFHFSTILHTARHIVDAPLFPQYPIVPLPYIGSSRTWAIGWRNQE